MSKAIYIRLIDRNNDVLTSASLVSVNRDPDGLSRGNNCHARLPIGAVMPLESGGTYTIDESPWCQTGTANIYFSLPSGMENVWGCGNDFDTDNVRIHPFDLVIVLSLGNWTNK